MRAHQDDLRPTSTLALRDPLAFDLRQAVANFLARLTLSPAHPPPAFLPSAHVQALLAVANGQSPAREALPLLADLLELQPLTQLVAESFRPIVEVLAGLWVDRTRGGKEEWTRRVVAGALIAAGVEEVWPILEHFIASSSFSLIPTVPTNLSSLPIKTLHPLLLTILRLLHLAPASAFPSAFLPLHARDTIRRLFASSTPSERAQDVSTRLLAIRAFCLWEGIPEATRHGFEKATLEEGQEWGSGDLYWFEGDEVVFPSSPALATDSQDVDMASDEHVGVEVQDKWSRAWVWPVIELERIQAFCSALNGSSSLALYDEPSDDVVPQLLKTDLPSCILLVANIFVFRPSPGRTQAGGPAETHIPTSSTELALARLALLTNETSPALLTSTSSSGKTHLVSHLAGLISPLAPLLISLADTSLDPKSLLGNYVSDPQSPGNFVYTTGSLAKAVEEGRWLILEDVDKARGEVLALVGELAEAVGNGARKVGARGDLGVPGKQAVKVHKDFRLIATRSSNALVHSAALDYEGQVKFGPPTFLGHQKFTEVYLSPPTSTEILEILARRFPVLGREPGVVGLLVQAWEVVRKGRKNSGAAGGGVEGREVGLRDLIKFVGRVEGLLQGPSTSQNRFNEQGQAINPLLQESIYLSALDIFFASLPSPSPALALKVGDVLGLNDERAEWCLNKRRPELVSWGGEGGGVVKGWKVGRGKLDARATNQAFYSPSASRPYALTRPSLLLLEQLTIAISNLEPLLLVGETGTGKTTSVTHLSSILRRNLVSLNLSTQTESSDLLGGFKPLDPKLPAGELLSAWLGLFERTFSRKKKTNKQFEDVLRKVVGGAKWSKAVEMWRKSRSLAWERLGKQREEEGEEEDVVEDAVRETDGSQPSSPRKRRKIQSTEDKEEAEFLLREWNAFGEKVDEFDVQHVKSGGRFMFSYVEGPLVKALRSGDWVLLDEVNLASPETLESLASILESSTSSVTLTERGDLEPIPRHPDFRLFSCMNPATDVGKKDLPSGLRARFTEIYVPSPDRDRDALRAIVEQYIGDAAVADRGAVDDMAELYLATKGLAESRQLADGSNLPPHYSIRTLARALTFAAQIAPNYGLRRALWEGFLMSFTMLLDSKSNLIVRALAEKMILGARNPKAILSQMPSMPAGFTEDDLVRFGHFWLRRGPLPADPGADYVLTPSVQAKLVDLSRVISTNRFPVLIQGPTSSGKTSAVEYLARRTGHRFVRINNHEHTDIQEYLGTYVSDPETGQLVFQEGVLVRAVRRGDWIVLDELNLAPTDVLEALNRLLDDNRELVIPETQEVIRPHPHFMLFATQNPPGLYGGRKVLSRAFRNRFLEVHFDDVPQAELEQILFERCQIAPSYAKLIVAVFQELQHRRQSARVFETKQSFATLRDLFRWGRRDAGSKEELADHGYMLLAERARKPEDKVVVKEVLEQILKVKIDEKKLYDLLSLSPEEVVARLGVPLPPASPSAPIVWTTGMQRLYTLVALSMKYDEPVLMVGETGCGKTSVCQLLSAAFNRHLYEVNCHQNMETADLLGGQKPVRNRAAIQGALVADFNTLLSRLSLPSLEAPAETVEQALAHIEALVRPGHAILVDALAALRQMSGQLKRSTALFEWHDGPLIQAMAGGELILLDEVSLADDSVLERLNSVLEPARTLVVVEKGGKDVSQMTIVGSPGFEVLATMNPGGDYGKKELSPALRNRFTEIWVPSLDNDDDLSKIVDSSWATDSLKPYGNRLLAFVRWFAAEIGEPSTPVVGVRDILAWVKFSNTAVTELGITEDAAFYEAAHLTLIDGLGTLPQISSLSASALRTLKNVCIAKLHDLLQTSAEASQVSHVVDTEDFFTIGSFGVPKGPLVQSTSSFSLRAPTTRDNAMRVLRGCQLTKPILLEGSPGVGKTSLITALAVATRNHLCRINLSDQTDLADLFGSDLPVENGRPGEFAWKDAAFLTALQSGQWVLLDEMNLASQAVLEGLNAVLDHRGTVYIPELGRSFTRHPEFRIFAAQNPVGQGGGRKGLPKSFLNRFTRVYVQELSPEDLRLICGQLYPEYPSELLERMIAFNSRLHQATMVERTIGRAGSPWEFNLRDVLRWLDLIHTKSGLEQRLAHPIEHLRTIYLQRFRSEEDRRAVLGLFEQFFSETLDLDVNPWVSASPEFAQIGHALINRIPTVSSSANNLSLLQSHLSPMEALARCVDSGWLVIVSGSPSSGKSSLIQSFAQLSGRRLRSFAMNSGVDTMELLGSFEQADPKRRAQRVVERLLPLAAQACARVVADDSQWSGLSNQLEAVQTLSFDSISDFHARVTAILDHLEPFLDESEALEYNWVLSALSQLSSSGNTTGRFEWVDGELVQAITAGDWLVIDNANLCSASVLDRINSLCETQGTLVLSERGSVDGVAQVLTPHPRFRLFMTLDPKHGELSRAMRNRGVELSLDDLASTTDLQRVSPASRRRVSSSLADPLGASVDRPIDSWTTLVPQDSFLAGSLPHDLLQTFTLSAGAAASSGALLHLVSAASPSSQAITQQLAQHNSNGVVSTAASTLLQELRSSTLLSTMAAQLTSAIQSATDLPAAVLHSQPLDPMLNPNLFADGNVAHLAASKIIELFVRTRLSSLLLQASLHSASVKHADDLTALERSFVVSAGRTLQKTLDTVALGVYPVVKSFYDDLASLMDSTTLLDGSLDLKPVLAVISKLADILHQLETVTSRPELDYSSIQVIVLWLARLVEGTALPQDLQTFSAALGHLQASIAYDAGTGQQELWLASLPSRSQQLFEDTVRRLTELLQGVSALHPSYHGLRSSALSLAATGSLEQLAADGLDGISNLSREIESSLAQVQETEAASGLASRTHKNLLVASGLEVIADALANPSHPHDKRLRSVLAISESLAPYPLTEMIIVQRALWSADLASKGQNVFINLADTWVTLAWLNTPEDDEVLSGSADVFRPVVLSAILNESNPQLLGIKDLPIQDKSLKEIATVLEVRSTSKSPSRQSAMTQLFLSSLSAVLQAFSSTWPADTLVRLGSLTESTIRQDFPSLLLDLESTTHSALKASLQTHLFEPLRLLFTSSDEPLVSLGRCWLGIATVILQLYIPAIPIDPSAAQRAELQLLRIEEARLSQELEAHLRAEEAITGNTSSLKSVLIVPRLDEIRLAIAQLGAMVVERQSDVGLLNAMFYEVHQFFNEVLAPSRVKNLVDSLANSPDEQALMQERSAQENIVGFCRRLDQTYRFFADLHRPIVLALGQLRTGLRVICRAAEIKRSLQSHQLEADLVPILTTFPTALGIKTLHAADLPVRFKTHVPAVPTSSLLLLGLAASVYDSGIGMAFDSTRVQGIATLFDQFTHLWLMDREREALAEQEAESLYRQRKVEEQVLTDIELEEKEFKELFPQFGDVLDEDDDQERHLSTQTQDKALKAAFILPGQAELALQLHTALFNPSSDTAVQHFYPTSRESIVRQIVERCFDALADNIDDSLAFQTSIVLQTLNKAKAQPSFPDGRPYDFYTDANPNEMRTAVKLLNRLVLRLEDISQEWPDQMVLRHLLDRCAAMLALKADSPIVRVIAAFEGLLLHTADWEAYANRDNTLAPFQTDIGNLIVDWRRLELSCWAQLLETQARNFASEVSPWWFKMYEILIHGGRAAAKEEAEVPESRATEAHAHSLVGLIDQFITTSPLGQFSPRLELLRTFSAHLNSLSGTPSDFTGLDRIARLVSSLTARYSLSEATIATSLRTQRDKIEQNVKDFIKLASWKDVNVHALKASAQHTHRQLHRCIRKFREVLRKPCNTLLILPESQRKPTDSLVRPSISTTSHSGTLLALSNLTNEDPTALVTNLPRMFEKYQSLLSTVIRPSFSLDMHEVINDAAVEIVTTSKALADETPSVMNDETTKMVKNMLNRKRAAWNTLLKELRKMGFSNRVKAPVLALQQSAFAIHSLPQLSSPSEISTGLAQEISRIEDYHFRMLVFMPELRDSLRSHHTDLTTPDLTKAVGFVESTLSVALTNRTSLEENLSIYNRLVQYVKRLDVLTVSAPSTTTVAGLGVDAENVVRQAATFLCQLSDALREVFVGRQEYQQTIGPLASSNGSVSILQGYLSSATQLRDSLAEIAVSVAEVHFRVILSTESATLANCETLCIEMETDLSRLMQEEPAVRHLYKGLSQLLSSRPSLVVGPNDTISTESTTAASSAALIRSFLNIAKAMNDSIAAAPPPDVEVPTKETANLLGRTKILRLSAVVSHLDQLVDSAATNDVAEAAIKRVAPFVAEYALLVQDHLFSLATWSGTVFKLAHILGNLTLSLSRKGFCSPQEAGDQEGGEGDEGQTSDGTGMGAGTGEGNVSEQIEDESQVEGLQGEEPEPKDKDQKKEDGGAIEMSEDFGGDLEDVSADGSDAESDDDDKDDDDESPPDEQIGDVDPLDENAVDEKFWGDEKGEDDDNKQDEKMDQDHSTEQSKESDLVAKENEQPQKQSGKEEPQPQPQPEDDQANDDEDAPIQDQEAEDDEEPEAEEQRGPGEKMPDHVPEADTLDLPDELDLDGGDEDEKEEEGGPDDTPMDDDGPLDDQPPADDGFDDSKKKDNSKPDDPTGEEEGQEEGLPSETPEEEPVEDEGADPSAQAQAEAGEEDAVPEEEEDLDTQVAKPKVESGNETSEEQQDTQMDDVGLEVGQEEASMDQQNGTKDDAGKQADAPSAERQDDMGDTTQEENASEPPPTSSESKGGQGETVPMDDTAETETTDTPQAEETNPMRNLGDALKEIRKRFEQISNPTEEDEPQLDGDPSMDPGEVEYAQEDDDKEMQALGPAPEDQVQALSDLKIADEEVEGEDIAHMDIDEENAPQPELPLVIQPPQELEASEDKALTQSEVRQRGQQKDPEQIDRPIDIEDIDAPPLTEEESKNLDREVEIKNNEWLQSDRSSASAEAMWRLYTSVTHDLSHTLCEQLRLILEPTLATRLKGDYRSGKRLNMKKIIPYIASEFTKDKIWLRRTRPSTREYQVLLALDDSRSMAESHSVHLAYSTLALISQAMTKLEVGDVGIAKFGEAFELLHNFEESTFSDTQGAKVMSQFRFDQKATNVLSLVERSLEVLAEARQRRSTTSSTSADIWQLELIISDGICQDHEKLRTLLRKAAEQRVMIVFLIVDSLHRTDTQPAGFAAPAEPSTKAKNSILNMKTAKYEVGSSGAMELTMETYLDTFPFEYYVVLRDVEALPEVLSDTLRQWMERVSEE